MIEALQTLLPPLHGLQDGVGTSHMGTICSRGSNVMADGLNVEGVISPDRP